jgi:hypothetical protein
MVQSVAPVSRGAPIGESCPKSIALGPKNSMLHEPGTLPYSAYRQ